jgi:hypothetical protein
MPRPTPKPGSAVGLQSVDVVYYEELHGGESFTYGSGGNALTVYAKTRFPNESRGDGLGLRLIYVPSMEKPDLLWTVSSLNGQRRTSFRDIRNSIAAGTLIDMHPMEGGSSQEVIDFKLAAEEFIYEETNTWDITVAVEVLRLYPLRLGLTVGY